MNTFQLACFLAVANSLSFARAAELLNVTQPTVTNQIHSLENELNVKLFHRSNKFVELTAEGQAFIADAQNMVDIAESAKRRFSCHTEKAVEKLSIGLSNYAQFDSLAETLNELSKYYSNLRPNLQIVPHEQLFHLLKNETVDIIFGIKESGGKQNNFKYRQLLTSSLVGVCRNDNPISQTEQIEFNGLKNEKLIFCDPFSASFEISKLQMMLVADKDPADIQFCTSAAATFVLASAGMGIALIPELFVPNVPHISKIKIADAPKISFGLFYNSSSGNEVLKRFIKITTEKFEDVSSSV